MTDRPEDRIEISADDLEELPPPPAPTPRLEITADDLLDIEDEPPRAFPGLPPGAPTPYAPLPKEKTGGRTSVSNLTQLCLAGAVGGLIGWAVVEPLLGNRSDSETFSGMLAEMGLFFGLICLCIGASFGAAEGIAARVWQKALTAGAIGAGIGFGGGFFGGIAAQLVYTALGGGTGEHGVGLQMLARALGWGLAGCFAGLGQGVAIRSYRKIAYGVLGGLAGGFVGGLMFDPIASLLSHPGGINNPGDAGMLSRAIAIIIVGLCAGLGIGLVEEIRKQGWLLVMSGLLKGKQFILYKEQTILGSSPKGDIVLPKDAAVQPQHASIRAERDHYVLQNLAGTPTVFLNGQPVNARVLRDGDGLQIGSTLLVFRTLAMEKTAPN